MKRIIIVLCNSFRRYIKSFIILRFHFTAVPRNLDTSLKVRRVTLCIKECYYIIHWFLQDYNKSLNTLWFTFFFFNVPNRDEICIHFSSLKGLLFRVRIVNIWYMSFTMIRKQFIIHTFRRMPRNLMKLYCYVS